VEYPSLLKRGTSYLKVLSTAYIMVFFATIEGFPLLRHYG